ncbi:AraC family transcriptional regulator [Enterobacillus tribolii]|uniref:AraC family transcriptional regulator n=1 Tax=Enterobacillus tribolii TaxID=1487935 RepID=A0A370QM39_9GAMM|nr:helix-turn-helix transcriptional regulator [Enterobacillus tribolii]MBW7982265.1 AraC family transcriptional regulator [Enterobacillus tribolii]RDK89434.1 AraC family transcriptional regulator [Enterobacillus tribolii]
MPRTSARLPNDEDIIIRNVQFRSEAVNAGTEYLAHNHPWGQVICVKSGVLALSVAGQRFLAPPEFAVWLPAGVEHSSYNRRPSLFRTINIAHHLCAGMPAQVCLLNVGPLFYAITENCFSRHLVEPQTRQDLRMCRVLVDQLKAAPVYQTYLPSTEDKFLAPILDELERCPADNTPLAEWAKRVYTTERTLSRRCQQELGMAFSEWRQRLRFLHSLTLLEQGKTVQEVALEVGYSSSSAFIVMFQQISGTTPERYRRQQ